MGMQNTWQGFCLDIAVQLTDDSTPPTVFTPENVGDVEICIGKVFKRFSRNELRFDTENNNWLFRLEERETYAMYNKVDIYAKIRMPGEEQFCYPFFVGSLNVLDYPNKEPLGGGDS